MSTYDTVIDYGTTTYTGTLTTGNVSIWPYDHTFYPQTLPATTGYWHVVESPRECSGDVHVFPCPHCATCKCGKATVKREAKGKK